MTPEELTARNQDMWNLRYVHGKTYREIGEKHKLSRERVGQIIGRSGRGFRREWTEKLIAENGNNVKNRFELENMPGIKRVYLKDWGKKRHVAIGGNCKFAQEFENRASVILEEYGIHNKLMPNRCRYDIETASGIKIDVKVSRVDVSKMKTQNNIYPCWQLPEMKSGRDCDFFMCFVPDVTEPDGFTYFVIPSFEFYGLSIGSRSRIPWPRMGQKPSKWHKYHKRIDIIKSQEKM